MTGIVLLAVVLVGSHIILYRMIVKMAKYQNFKSNILMRLALSENFKSLNEAEAKFYEIDDPDWMKISSEDKHRILDEIKQKINVAIDEELDNDSSWEDTLVAIKAEVQFFHVDNSYPFYQIFNQEIIKRFNERNKKIVKKKI